MNLIGWRIAGSEKRFSCWLISAFIDQIGSAALTEAQAMVVRDR
jgi:hypothetical protein